MVVGRISPTASAIFKKDGFRSDAMLNKVMNFLRDEEGATAIEYALIIGLIAIVIVAALITLNGGLTGLFTKVSDCVAGLNTAACS